MPFIQYNARSVDLIAWYFCRVLGVNKKINFDWKLRWGEKIVAIFRMEKKLNSYWISCGWRKVFFNSAYYWFATWMSINLMWMKRNAEKPANFFFSLTSFSDEGSNVSEIDLEWKSSALQRTSGGSVEIQPKKRKLNGWK